MTVNCLKTNKIEGHLFGWLKALITPFRSSLVQRITATIFLSIIAIEIIILVPSYLRMEDQLVDHLVVKGEDHATTMIRALDNSKNLDADFKNYAKSLFALPAVKGLAFYLTNKNAKCLVGELPSSSYSNALPEIKQIYLKRFARLEIVKTVTLGGHVGKLILRMDASHIPVELMKFVKRIIGLVMIISTFVTVVTMIVLNKLLFEPILNLRESLMKGRGDVWSVSLSWRGLALRNEIGDLYRVINSHLRAQRQTRSCLFEIDENRDLKNCELK